MDDKEGKQISVRKINNYTRKIFGDKAEWPKRVKQQVGKHSSSTTTTQQHSAVALAAAAVSGEQ
jgi:hypothetical protein